MTHLVDRRTILRGAVLTPLAAALAACADNPNAIPEWMNAIEAVGQEAALVLPQLVQAGMPADVRDQATTIIDRIEAAAKAVGGATSATQGQSILIQIEADINALAPIAAPFIGLIPGGTALGLIIAALPAIEAMVNITVSLLSSQSKALAASAPKPAAIMPGAAARPLSPDEALALLLQHTGR